MQSLRSGLMLFIPALFVPHFNSEFEKSFLRLTYHLHVKSKEADFKFSTRISKLMLMSLRVFYTDHGQIMNNNFLHTSC